MGKGRRTNKIKKLKAEQSPSGMEKERGGKRVEEVSRSRRN